MTEKASLIIEVIEDGVKKTTIDLKRLTESAKYAEKSTDGLGRSMSDLDSKAKRAGGALALMSKVAATYLTYEAVKKARDMADVMQNLNTQVRFVTGSYEEAIAVQGKLFNIATRTYSSLEATTILYTRTARALKDANKSQADFLKFTEAINNAMRIGGANATEQASALLQLSQALGSGVLQGDEFRSIAENAPILLDLVAKELGVVRGEVKALSAEGKITSEVIFNALTNASGQLEQEASRIAVTAGAALQNLKSKMMQYTGEILNGSGATSTFATVVAYLANNLEFVLAPAMGGAAVYAAIRLTKALTTLTGFGGPIMIAVGVVSMLASAWNHNSQEIEKMRGEIGLATEDLLKMSKAQVESHEVKLKIVLKDDKKSLKELEENLKSKEERLANLSDSISKMNESTRNNKNNATNIQYADLKDDIAPLREEFEALSKSIARNEEQLKKIPSILKSVEYNDFYKGFHGPIPELVGPVKPKGIDDINKALDEYQKKSDQAKIKTHEQAMALLLQDDAFKHLNKSVKDGYTLRAAQIDTDNKAYDSAESVTKMLEDLADKAEKAGKSMREIYLIDLRNNGATEEQIREAMASLDVIINNTPSKGKSSIDHYNDRLQDMSRELSEIISLNKELEATGYTSQYNAVSRITLELNDQSSTLSKISEAQKQILIDQAQQIDNANQLNAILNFSNDYSRRFEDMEFELELMGKTKREIEGMRFAYELEKQAKQMSIGMSRANIETLKSETEEILKQHSAYRQAEAMMDGSYFEGIKTGFADYIDSVGNVREQTAGAITMTFGHLESQLVNFAQTSKFSFSDMTSSILQDLSKILIRMGMMNMVVAGFGENGTGGFFGSLFKEWGWFADGGYTGHGGVHQPAGVVHKGEVVFSQRDIARLGGVGVVEGLRTSGRLPGYSSGGVVGAPPKFIPNIPSSQQGQQKSGDIIINQTIHYQGDKGEEDGKNAGQDFAAGFKTEVRRILADEKRPGGMLYR